MKIIITLFVATVGISAAFFPKPAVPHQLKQEPVHPVFLKGYLGPDSALDNVEIAADANITPARKCGFCMG